MSAMVLVVEDDADIVRVVGAYLERDGFIVEVARDGLTGLHKALELSPNLIILDWMLPHLDGLSFMQQIKQRSLAPIIMLTAKIEERDRLAGLELADDYVTKPFSPRELVARVKAVLRRGQSLEKTQEIVLGDLVIEPSKRSVKRGNEPLDLTTLEFDLLYALAREPERVFTRSELLDRVWGRDFTGIDRVVDVHISNLRQKLEVDPEQPQFLITVRGVGYKVAT
jgi:DNA-binding response OmpR family regulator